MKSLLSVAALCIFSASYSQDFIVTLKSDTLRGELKILSYDLMDRLQIGEGKQKTVLTATQVRRAFIHGEVYAPVKFDNSIRLMKLIRTGFLSLYAFRLPNQVSYDGRLLSKLGSVPQEVPNLGFKRYVGALVEDCPEVADKVKAGELGRADVEALVDEYNKCVDAIRERKFAVVAEKNTNPTSDLIEQVKTKVAASDLTTKPDVTDLLNNINDKVKKNEPVPAYLKEGLKGYLSQRDDFKEDVEKLLALLK